MKHVLSCLFDKAFELYEGRYERPMRRSSSRAYQQLVRHRLLYQCTLCGGGEEVRQRDMDIAGIGGVSILGRSWSWRILLYCGHVAQSSKCIRTCQDTLVKSKRKDCGCELEPDGSGRGEPLARAEFESEIAVPVFMARMM